MNYFYQIEGALRNNIGDVLQGIVAKAFLHKNISVADRESLADLDKSEPGVLIANGWYMHSFEKFPPPANINPIYVSVHVAQSKLLADPLVREHFKKYSPIGCRDTKTLELFLGWGIPAYYSSCLTITTKRKAIDDSKKGEVLLVDNVDHPIPEEIKNKLESILGTSFTRISHDPPNTDSDLKYYAESSEKHMEELLTRYCNASLVVTTKIHCALPCLGMGANVLLVHPNPADPRLATVREFIDIVSYKDVLKGNVTFPKVNQAKLDQRREFLTRLVEKSVQNGYNALSKPDNLQYRLIKLRSVLNSYIYRAGIIACYKLGIMKDKIEKVYGSGF